MTEPPGLCPSSASTTWEWLPVARILGTLCAVSMREPGREAPRTTEGRSGPPAQLCVTVRSPCRKRCPWQAFSLHTDDLRISSSDRTGSLGWLTSATAQSQNEKPHPLCPNPPVPFSFTETPKFSFKVSGYNDDSTNPRGFSLNQMTLDSEVQSCQPGGQVNLSLSWDSL